MEILAFPGQPGALEKIADNNYDVRFEKKIPWLVNFSLVKLWRP